MNRANAARSPEPADAWTPQRPELASANDRFFDYCYWKYEPLAPPAGRLRSSNLLFHSFDVANARPLYEVCRSIRDDIGPLRTVWGVKWVNGTLSWELYFYDYQRLQRSLSLSRLIETLSPYAECSLEVNEKRPYFMFSLDVDASWAAAGEGRRATLAGANIYVGNIGCSVSSGLSYALDADGLRFENLYYFFDAKKEFEQVLQKVSCSAFLDLPGLNIDHVLWPEMIDCGCIVAANKRDCEAVYFSRIRVGQLLYFMRRMEYPARLIDYIETNAGRLDHQYFDVGIDYRMHNGRLEVVKSSYYGSL